VTSGREEEEAAWPSSSTPSPAALLRRRQTGPEARSVDYDEIDVYTVPGAREKLAELTGGMNVVPVIIEEDGEVRIAAGGG